MAVGRTGLANDCGIGCDGQQPARQESLSDRGRILKIPAAEGIMRAWRYFPSSSSKTTAGRTAHSLKILQNTVSLGKPTTGDPTRRLLISSWTRLRGSSAELYRRSANFERSSGPNWASAFGRIREVDRSWPRPA